MQKEFEMSKPQIERGSGNVYADLGQEDAAEMQVKAHLAAKIGDIVRHRQLTQQQAAKVLGLSQPKLSGVRHALGSAGRPAWFLPETRDSVSADQAPHWFAAVRNAYR